MNRKRLARRSTPAVVVALLATIAAGSLGTVDPAGALKATALQVAATGAPQRVHGTDGREHIDYDLVITNNFTAEVTLTSLVVRGGGRKLLTLQDQALADHTHPTTLAVPPDSGTTTIPPAGAVATLIDVMSPRSAGRSVPKRLSHRIRYTFPDGAPVEAVIGSKTVRAPDLRVDRRAPVEIAPPLRGEGWVSANACCDPSFPHRNTLLAANGTFVAPEMFAVDYIRVVDGRVFTGDGTENTDYSAYGVPIRAATGGRVISVINDRPEIPPVPPGQEEPPNPTLTKPSDFGGNSAAVKIRPGVFVFYAHMQPGSVRVKAGERVRTGQKLGLLGNSGNTSGPHLHFSINEGPDLLTFNSLPFEIDRFGFEGTAGEISPSGELPVTGKRQDARREHPLVGSVSDYSR